MSLRRNYAAAQAALIDYQKTLSWPPERKEINKQVAAIIKQNGLRGTTVERYFWLWAVCALLNQEKLVRNWRVRHGAQKKKSRSSKGRR